MTEQKITEEMTIAQVLEKYPEATEVLHKNLGFCTTCPSASMETLALGAHLHNINVKKLIKDLNQVLEDKSSKKD